MGAELRSWGRLGEVGMIGMSGRHDKPWLRDRSPSSRQSRCRADACGRAGQASGDEGAHLEARRRHAAPFRWADAGACDTRGVIFEDHTGQLGSVVHLPV